MDAEERLINYVEQTPMNSNPNVLKSLIGDVKKQSGDMKQEVYDPDGEVAEAGGIVEYVESHSSEDSLEVDFRLNLAGGVPVTITNDVTIEQIGEAYDNGRKIIGILNYVDENWVDRDYPLQFRSYFDWNEGGRPYWAFEYIGYDYDNLPNGTLIPDIPDMPDEYKSHKANTTNMIYRAVIVSPTASGTEPQLLFTTKDIEDAPSNDAVVFTLTHNYYTDTDTATCNKTFEEVNALLENHKPVSAVMEYYVANDVDDDYVYTQDLIMNYKGLVDDLPTLRFRTLTYGGSDSDVIALQHFHKFSYSNEGLQYTEVDNRT